MHPKRLLYFVDDGSFFTDYPNLLSLNIHGSGSEPIIHCFRIDTGKFQKGFLSWYDITYIYIDSYAYIYICLIYKVYTTIYYQDIFIYEWTELF